ncbi:MAG: GNAT family N-acetyltransferase, partial [Lachnospiraceae bacterium]|nr:GNAT family N-acetyltransferase [Lachnospiraceae bacterium]
GFFDSEGLRDRDLQLLLKTTTEAGAREGTTAAYHFDICGEGGQRIGQCDLHLGHSERLYFGGNIGYRVEEAFRGRHVAVRVCRLLFELAARHGLGYVIISCFPENGASRATAEASGCRLLETARLPLWHELSREGNSVCIYGKSLEEVKAI